MMNFQSLSEYYSELPLIIKIVWIFIIVFMIFIIFITAYLKYLRGYLRKKEDVSNKLFEEYQTDLVQYLYSETENGEINEDQKKIISKIKKSISNRLKRRICITVLSKLKNDISGELAIAINNLYIKTELINYSKSKLKSKKWNVVASGIKELNLFEITDEIENVRTHENHKNLEVRNEVQLYLVSLFQFNGLNFLNDLETQISEWNQIQLLEILQKNNSQETPDITPWLKSSNNSVVLFSLKLAKIYNQFQVISTLLDLLHHKNLNIKIKVIELLAYFQVNESKHILKSDFSERTEEEQIAFFKMLEHIVEKNDEDFIVENTKNPIFEIKSRAISYLHKINNDKLQWVKDTSTNVEDQLIFNYLENK